MKNFVIVTPAHPEVLPRNWAIHAPKDTKKCGDRDPPTCQKTPYFGVCFLTLGTLIKCLRHSDKVRDTPRAYQLSVWGLASMKNVIENKDVYGVEIPCHGEEGM